MGNPLMQVRGKGAQGARALDRDEHAARLPRADRFPEDARVLGPTGFARPTSPPAPDRFLRRKRGSGGGAQSRPRTPTPTPPPTDRGWEEERAARGIAPSMRTLWRRMYARGDFPLRVEHKGRNTVKWTRAPTNEEIALFFPLFVEGCLEASEPHRFVAYAGALTLVSRFERPRGPRGPLCRCAPRATESFLKTFQSDSLITNAVGLDVFLHACRADPDFATCAARGPRSKPGLLCRRLVAALGKLSRVDARRCQVDMGYGRGRSVHVASAAADALNAVRLAHLEPPSYPARLDFQATAAGVPLPPRPRTAFGATAPAWERDVLVTRSMSIERGSPPRRSHTALRRSWPTAPPDEPVLADEDDDGDREAFARRASRHASSTNGGGARDSAEDVVRMASPRQL